jgi:diguanylate cyclase (GGDEF)-like protein/PAS domain S-box-containing protein
MPQLFQNLISNALKYHRQEEAPLVTIDSMRLKSQLDVCQIAVKDNGIGFDEKYCDRIFQVFQRLHGFRGDWRYHPINAHQLMSNKDSQRLKILLVEDDEDDFILLQDLLSDIQGTDLALEWIDNYEEALQVIQKKQHDVYLFDYWLGKNNGLELLRIVIANGCKTPVIMLTGHREREKDLEAMLAGAADYLVKGEINPSLLERSIRYAINRAQTLEALRESEERYALAALGANDGLWDWNLITNEVYFSERWKSTIGLNEEEKENFQHAEQWLQRIHPEDIERFKEKLSDHLRGLTPYFESEYRIQHSNGMYLWALSRGLAVRSANGQPYRMAGSQTDLSHHRVLYDQLTGLSNRTLFIDQLERTMKRTKRQPDYLFAVIFLDCDRFKIINDSLGHLVGDQLLIQVGKRLLKCLRPGDIVARLGGDEFAILLENVKDVNDATRIAHRMNQELMQPFSLMGHLVYISASIGIALNSQNCQQPEDLLRNADTAMYRAKALGKARYEVFDTTMHAQAQARLQLETALRQALDRNEFYLNYQPIISLTTNQGIGFEALVRWQHPEKGIISPADFIPVAEETGLIIPLSQWILREACAQMKAWQEQFPACQSLTMSVNLSRKQLSQPDLAEQIESIIQEIGLKAGSLKLEVTETGLMNEYEEKAAIILSKIKELGVQLSLDDFGTGYSSLSCINSFPIDTLKLDRAFVNNMTLSNKNADIVRAIVSLAHGLGIKVTAEGVETSEQLSQLQVLKCDYAQGYYFSRPLSSEAITSWIATTFQETLVIGEKVIGEKVIGEKVIGEKVIGEKVIGDW